MALAPGGTARKRRRREDTARDEREEDLSFIDPRRVKVAVWTATIHVDRDGFVVERRTNRVTYPSEAEVVGVVRLNVTGVPDDAAVPRLADAIIGTRRPFRPVEHQVDFDARLSQRAFYRRLLEQLRVRTGGTRLSIAALASWCFHDDWTRGLPVDAVVPMLYRMGRDGDVIRHTLHAERAFPNPACAGQVRYSADEAQGDSGQSPAVCAQGKIPLAGAVRCTQRGRGLKAARVRTVAARICESAECGWSRVGIQRKLGRPVRGSSSSDVSSSWDPASGSAQTRTSVRS